jgi:F0F1-type ATP synthase membrane subunit b/b'
MKATGTLHQSGSDQLSPGSDDTEALARLREHERELDRQLEDARQKAADLIAQAQQEADRLRENAAAELRQEIERLRQQASADLERAVAAARQETSRKIDELRQQAERRKEPTLGWLVGQVLGKEPR